jgi:hypothetical protein
MQINEETAKLDRLGKCPECNADWCCAGDIFTVLRGQDWCKNRSDEELRTFVETHYAPPYKFSRLVGVQLPYDHPEHYDGVSYYQCPDCNHQWPRFKKG